MNGFEIFLPFLKPIDHLILDDSMGEVMVNGTAACSSKNIASSRMSEACRSARGPLWLP
jgi:hypothetical protein